MTYRDYKDFHESNFIDEILDQHIFSNTNLRVTDWVEWKSVFLKVSDKHAPTKTARMKKRCSPWVTREVIDVMYRRDRAHARAIKSKDPELMNKYRRLRNEVNYVIERNKSSYMDNVFTTSRNNPRKFWAEMKRLVPKVNMKSIPRTISADDFNVYFQTLPEKVCSLFKDQTSDLLWKGQRSIHQFTFTQIERDALLRKLTSLSPTSGVDILGIDRKLLRIAAPYIVDSLCTVINDSLSNGIVHDEWKLARVTPVYKNSGDVMMKENYRPISVIGHIAKIIEQLIGQQLITYLEDHRFISPDQSAYLKRHSTQTSLHRVIDDFLENVNEDMITGVCFLDISKCFDTIDHSLLLKKLNMYGIQNTELCWFQSYLHNRKQAVFCHGKLSQSLDIKTGVPQGSVLGPYMFLLFINDVTCYLTEGITTNLFADDSSIYAVGKSIDEVRTKLQACIDSISYWYRRNKLKINGTKSKIMLVGTRAQLQALHLDDFRVNYEDHKLELVYEAKYLGLHISYDLTWDNHISYLCKQLYFCISMLRGLRKILNETQLLKIYKTYVQPKFDYGVTIWGCTTEQNLNKIQRIQNLAARVITGNFDYINTRGIDLVKHLKLQNIRQRRDYFITTLMFKSIHGLAPNYLCDNVTMNFDINGYNTRGCDNMNVYIPRPYKEIYRNSFAYQGAVLWNALPPEVKESANLDEFKAGYMHLVKLQDQVHEASAFL